MAIKAVTIVIHTNICNNKSIFMDATPTELRFGHYLSTEKIAIFDPS